MVNPDNLFGRLGNRMFQMATLYTHAKDSGVDIYFQDPIYFEKYESDIKNLFGTNIGFLPYVGIHIRRGDYVNNPFYVDLSQTQYYKKALKFFPYEKFLVFSDDPEFARDYFPDEKNFQIIEGGDELEDLNMLASCSIGIITANSSYSWWAAYLNPNPTAKIIAPSSKHWYSDGLERTKCPDSWLRI